MVDSPIESRQSDQDDDSDECHPDEMETKRVEEVSERYFHFFGSVTHRLVFLFIVHNGSIARRLFVGGKWRNENGGR